MALSKRPRYEDKHTYRTPLTLNSHQRRIHDRVQSDLPAFESQLSTARSVQERLKQLGSNVDNLHHSITDTEVRTLEIYLPKPA